ncbi:MAG: hypothetical protein ATN34_01630 [Epulopiscium sp. Nele67-Bin002]|nr:MAG: hypothetical protein ATN34_01630 [Epulopiscium sp. Nele67-Bin002]
MYIMIAIFFSYNSYLVLKMNSLVITPKYNFKYLWHLVSILNGLVIYWVINSQWAEAWHFYLIIIALLLSETCLLYDDKLSDKLTLALTFPCFFATANVIVVRMYSTFRGEYFYFNEAPTLLTGISISILLSLAEQGIFKRFSMTQQAKYEADQEVERLQMYRKLLLSRSISVIELDINADKINFYMHQKITPIEWIGKSYSTFLGEIITPYIHVGDRDKVRDRTKLEYIRQIYANGITHYEVEARFCENSPSYEWVKIMFNLHKNSMTGEWLAIISVVNIHSEKEKELQLLSRAERDLFTGLYNKTTTIKLISSYLTSNTDGALFIIDLDNFKAVNDILSHSIGDIAITEAASKLVTLFDENTILGRFGGDEFIVFTKTADFNLTGKCQELCSALIATYFDDTNSVSISASIGVAVVSKDCSDFDTLFNNADVAVYASKEAGKNTFTIG